MQILSKVVVLVAVFVALTVATPVADDGGNDRA